MSRRNQYLNTLVDVRSGAYWSFGGGVILIALAFLEAPPNRSMIVGGILVCLAAGWLWRVPTSRVAVPLVAALVAVAVLLLRNSAESSHLLGSGLMGAAALRLAAGYWLLKDHPQSIAVAAPDSPEEAAERELEDLVEDVRQSTMDTDPNRVEFFASDLWRNLVWVGRLRKSTAVLVYHGATNWGPPKVFFLVVPESDFDVRVTRKRFFGRGNRASFRIGEHLYKGSISSEAYDRYAHWKRQHRPHTPW